ncbi:P-loop containing nucleoside triphosphate hydrolase protein [Ascodesmis nigricans]|uniref:P-loop containing nucleoside triphosphate hydrolase protein n=1 Tax=Ascodesmis nigricans TaxID=341454 RepID=A0A4S2N5E5_9PEZI|nr:P-loop containing nucleoside triphosphate hydrolase protein [Ascodesmis nigricans]
MDLPASNTPSIVRITGRSASVRSATSKNLDPKATPKTRGRKKKSSILEESNTSHVSPTTSIATHPDLPSPSEAQHKVLTALLTTSSNIVINACAGSGKTTTILLMASAAPHLRFLVLLYNRRLMVETIERVERLGLSNITVINYHSLGVRNYSSECATDIGLRRVVLDDAPLLSGAVLPECDVLVMDEQQDMTPCLKRFTDKLLRDMDRSPKKPPVRVVALGDERQEMYGFNNSDSRFLTYTAKPEVFGYLNDHSWVEIDQPHSNRVTQQNIDFINQQMLHPPHGGRRMYSAKPYNETDPKPRYVVTDTWDTPLDEVGRLLDMGLRYEDIIILAPSVRGRCPIIRLMNTLALLKYPVHVADSDISEVNPEVSRGKILACTYHQAKGIEREAAIIFGFDISYHVYYHRTHAPMIAASNAQYVAATRAKKHLVLLHDQSRHPLPFVNMETLPNSCDVIVTDPPNATAAISPPVEKSPEEIVQEASLPVAHFSVTSLTRNLPSTVITACLRHLDLHWISDPHFAPVPPGSVKDAHNLTEGISEITGTAVPPLYQYYSTENLNPLRRNCTLISTAVSVLRQPIERVFNLPPLSSSSSTPASSCTASTTSISASGTSFPEPPHLLALRRRLREISAKWELTHTLTTPDILFLAAIHSGSLSNLITKLLSIPLTSYNWLNKTVVSDIFYTLRRVLPSRGLRFEAKLLGTVKVTGATGKSVSAVVRGSADVVKRGKALLNGETEADKVWEIKYTESLAPQHVLQTAVYAALMQCPPPKSAASPSSSLSSANSSESESTAPPPPEAYLINARTSQALRISGDFNAVVHRLVRLKTGVDTGGLVEHLTNEEFLDEAKLDWENWENEVGVPRWFSQEQRGWKMAVGWKGKKKKGEGEVVGDVEIPGEEVVVTAVEGQKPETVKKKRGRPKKSQTIEKVTEVAAPEEKKEKKKRGRPRKVPTSAQQEKQEREETGLVETVVEGRTKEGRKVPVKVTLPTGTDPDEVLEAET